MAIKGIIWDLDNTLYLYNDHFWWEAVNAAARVVVSLNPALDIQQVLAGAPQGARRLREIISHFTDTYGLSRDELMERFDMDPGYMKPDLQLAAAFAAASQKHVVLTHAGPRWAEGALINLGLRRHFSDVICMSVPSGPRKHKDEIPFEIALTKLGLLPEQAAMVDDDVANLIIPKRLGITTVLRGDIASPDVDIVCATPQEALRQLQNFTISAAAAPAAGFSPKR